MNDSRNKPLQTSSGYSSLTEFNAEQSTFPSLRDSLSSLGLNPHIQTSAPPMYVQGSVKRD